MRLIRNKIISVISKPKNMESIKRIAKTYFTYLILVIGSVQIIGCDSGYPDKIVDSDSNGHIRFGIPYNKGQILYRKGYVLLYDKDKKDPLWVSYHLTADNLNTPKLKRSNKFAPDPDLLMGERAELADYRNSGYDRGHMCPNADQCLRNSS